MASNLIATLDSCQSPPPKSSSAAASAPIVDMADVKRLLHYVAENGRTIDSATLSVLLPAVAKGNAAWTEPDAPTLYSAVAKLATVAAPVTAESICASENDAPRQITIFRWVAIALSAVILPLSYCSFTTSQLSKTIDADLTALSTSVVLQDGTRPANQPDATPTVAPSTRWQDLQKFNLSTRTINEEAKKLNGFLFYGAVSLPTADPGTLQLVPSSQAAKSVQARSPGSSDSPLTTYVQVLMFTKQVQNDIAVYYGVLNVVVLPVLYALLGACAFLLRLFTVELHSQTFSSRYVIAARFVVAMIAGLIVGLFNNVPLTQATSLSPQALAFLVGYASDVFFSFLEGIIQTVKKPPTSVSAATA